jgi:hypothetical protein
LPHDAVKVPAIVFAVWDAIVYWKFPHVLADGSVGVTDDVQTPTTDGDVDDPDVGVPAGAEVPDVDVEEGASTLDECWKPHAPRAAAAARTARIETGL